MRIQWRGFTNQHLCPKPMRHFFSLYHLDSKTRKWLWAQDAQREALQEMQRELQMGELPMDESPACPPSAAADDAAVPPPPPAPLATLGDVLEAALHAGKQKLPRCPRPRAVRVKAAELRRCDGVADLCVLEEQARRGDMAAVCVLAERYRANGYEHETYMPLLQAAARAGVARAQWQYGVELWEAGELGQAEEMVRCAARGGCGQGCFYLYGKLQCHSSAKALELLQLAARAGHVQACRELSAAYEQKRLRPEKGENAVYWMKRAGDLGDTEALFLYARMLEARCGADYMSACLPERYSAYRRAAEAGHVDAMLGMAVLCCHSARFRGRWLPRKEVSAKQDYVWFTEEDRQAVEWFLRAAKACPERVDEIVRMAREHLADSGQCDLKRALGELGYGTVARRLGKPAQEPPREPVFRKPHRTVRLVPTSVPEPEWPSVPGAEAARGPQSDVSVAEMRELKKRVKLGDAAAAYELAVYHRAHGRPHSVYMPLLQAATHAGLPQAQGLYGAELWLEGSRLHGLRLVCSAARRGSGQGCFILYLQSKRIWGPRGENLLKLAAEAGYLPACLEMFRVERMGCYADPSSWLRHAVKLNPEHAAEILSAAEKELAAEPLSRLRACVPGMLE